MNTINIMFGLSLYATLLTLMAATMLRFLQTSDRPDLLVGAQSLKVDNNFRRPRS
jgi:hypothetical protein